MKESIREKRHPRAVRKAQHRRKTMRNKRSLSRVTLYRGEAKKKRLSRKGRRADALALRAEERRDKLRKAAGRSKYPVIRGYLNGETHMPKRRVSISESIAYGGEPGELKHLSSRRKRKKHRFPK